MKTVSYLAIAALMLGTPAITSDLGIFDGAAQAGNHADKSNNGKGAEKSAAAKSKSAGKSASAKGKGSEKSAGKRNVSADLKGVNSLNRSLNGLMNSNDPKMAGFRTFVVESAAYEQALDVLEDSEATYAPLAMSYSDQLAALGFDLPNTTADWDMLETDLDGLATAPMPTEDAFTTVVPSEVEGEEDQVVFDEVAYNEAVAAWTESTAAATAAQDDYAATREAWLDYTIAFNDAASKEGAASEETMVEAIVASLNATGAGPVTTDDISDEMTEWVAARLGTGDDLDGLIDAYLATLTE